MPFESLVVICLAESEHFLTSETGVTIGASAAVVIAVLGIYKYLRDNFDLLRSERRSDVATLQRDIDRIFHRLNALDVRRGETWTLDNQRVFASELGRLNPTIRIPDPGRIVGRESVSEEDE